MSIRKGLWLAVLIGILTLGTLALARTAAPCPYCGETAMYTGGKSQDNQLCEFEHKYYDHGKNEFITHRFYASCDE